MRIVRELFNKSRKHFEKDGRLKIAFPLFEAMESFFFTSGKVTGGPSHIRDNIDLKRLMMTVVFASMPAMLMALYNTGYQANLAMAAHSITEVAGWRGMLITASGLGVDPANHIANIFHGSLYYVPVYILTLAVGGAWEVIFAAARKHEISEGFLVTSALFPLILPPTIPLWQVALGISFGVVIGKELFGGVGMNILNPALTGRAFLFFAYPAQISGNAVWVAVDGVTAATPLSVLSARPMADAASSATPYVAKVLEPITTATVSWWDAFFGLIPGAMGETSALACLFGAAVLIYTGVGSKRIMLSVVAGMVALSLLFNLIGSDTNPMFAVNPMWHFVLGGFAFGTVFMATDPVTAAMTEEGKIIYGLMIGALIVLIRVINPAFPEGTMLAILFCNVFAPIIDRIFINLNIKRRQLRSGS